MTNEKQRMIPSLREKKRRVYGDFLCADCGRHVPYVYAPDDLYDEEVRDGAVGTVRCFRCSAKMRDGQT